MSDDQTPRTPDGAPAEPPAEGDGGAVAAERAAELAALRRAQDDLADVDRALERLDDGSYGTCEVCGAALADEVLAEAPATRTCPAHPVPTVA